MKLELSVSKQSKTRPSGAKKELVFSVIDLDKANGYPRNFFCIPAKTRQMEGYPLSQFCQIFGKDSNRIAVELLTNALKSEGDLEVREEIEKRLKAFQPKPPAKCSVCGCVFEPRKYGHFFQRVCRKCGNKNSSSH